MSNQAIEQDNLDNGQWSELVSFESTQSKKIDYVVIDADQDFFSSQKQAEKAADRRFIDASAPKKILESNTVLNFFSRNSRKTRSTKNGYVLSSSFDKYRQGSEITQFGHWTEGFFKILSGEPGHIVKSVCLGINEDNNLTDNNFFQELNLFDPIKFISVQGTDKLIEQVITFPIVTSDANQRENYVLNGIIEPFPIRPIISHFSIYFPVDPQGIKANFSNADPLQKKQSDLVDSISEFSPNQQNKEPFFDGGEALTMTNDEGDSTVEVGPSLPYYMTDTNYLTPFSDAVYARGDVYESSKTYESDLLAVVRRMPKQGMTYIKQNEFSSRTGFTYNNNALGTDSIVYGGIAR